MAINDHKEIIDAEVMYMASQYGFSLQLVITRMSDDIIQFEFPIGGNRIIDRIEQTVQAAIPQVESIKNNGRVDTNDMFRSLNNLGMSVYHNESGVNASVEGWHIRVSPGSSICPGEILCNDGIDDLNTLERVSNNISQGAEIHHQVIMDNLKAQMATMKL